MSEIKEPVPVLVKKDGERQAVASTMTRDELLAGMQMIAEAIRSGQQGQAAQAGELADAMAQIKSDLNKGEYNVQNFPDRSVFNPKGELHAPRPEIDGEVFWVGTLMDAREHTPQEIDLINALTPGTYHGGRWEVINLLPGHTGKRKLLVKFPCKDFDDRAALPGGYAHPTETVPVWNRRTKQMVLEPRQVSGIEQMCTEMIHEAAGLIAVPA